MPEGQFDKAGGDPALPCVECGPATLAGVQAERIVGGQNITAGSANAAGVVDRLRVRVRAEHRHTGAEALFEAHLQCVVVAVADGVRILHVTELPPRPALIDGAGSRLWHVEAGKPLQPVRLGADIRNFQYDVLSQRALHGGGPLIHVSRAEISRI